MSRTDQDEPKFDLQSLKQGLLKARNRPVTSYINLLFVYKLNNEHELVSIQYGPDPGPDNK